MQFESMLDRKLILSREEFRTKTVEVRSTFDEYIVARTCFDRPTVERNVDERFQVFDHDVYGCYLIVVVDYQSV